MKKNEAHRLNSLRELRLHRQELELEIRRTELDIRDNVRELTGAFSPGNILRTVGKEISMVRIVGSGIGLVKKLFSRKKKKKKAKDEEADA